MKIGVFSDIHGNLEALDAVLGDMTLSGTDRFWCLGDVVGYGADPNECVERVRNIAETTVLGNHDLACVDLSETANFNRYAREACTWTEGQLTEKSREWLKSLELTATIDDVTLVHSSPYQPQNWRYMLYISDMVNGFKALTTPMAFIGHSHQPIILVRREGEYFSINSAEHRVEDGNVCIVNAGSVGQPRDGDPRACYAIWEPEEGKITLKRVSYDVETAQKKIRAAGLPDILASRLEFGN